ncbi:zeta-carotene desaturase-like protein [Anopheles sinensis]|uniref:Zeta-carotene desaturase-like protein n=1 Tax=Anopheles sinensis TaxID=74873 RepID=A0A084VHQ7_ANOSI|nr:zeta-carotene desaturase-like protein [Anopheles sinensis]
MEVHSIWFDSNIMGRPAGLKRACPTVNTKWVPPGDRCLSVAKTTVRNAFQFHQHVSGVSNRHSSCPNNCGEVAESGFNHGGERPRVHNEVARNQVSECVAQCLPRFSLVEFRNWGFREVRIRSGITSRYQAPPAAATVDLFHMQMTNNAPANSFRNGVHIHEPDDGGQELSQGKQKPITRQNSCKVLD